MPAGKGIVIAALGGLALLAFAGGAAASSSGALGPAGDECIDDHMPPDMKQQVKELLANKKITPADLELAGNAAEANGFPKAAKCLRKRAKDKRAAAEAEVINKGGMPHIIRYGDIPSIMANYYTGDPLRFKELGPLNPQIGPLKTVNGVTNYQNWRPGLEILIPKSWNPLDKPVPPPASGGGGGGGAKPSGPLNPDEVHEGWADVIEDIFDELPWNTPDPEQNWPDNPEDVEP